MKKQLGKANNFELKNYQIKNSHNFNFLEDQFNQNMLSNMPSPISQMKFDVTSTASKDDILNYSSNTYYPEQNVYNHKSCAQSPTKQDNSISSKYLNQNKRQSIPDIRVLTEMNWKKSQNYEIQTKNNSKQEYQKSFKKKVANKINFKLQNQEQLQNCYLGYNKVQSQKNIQASNNTFRNQESYNKYEDLAKNYQHIQRQFEKVKQENRRLRNAKQELMHENIGVKRQAQSNIDQLTNEIENLKQQIYRFQMQRQQSSTNRFVNSRMNATVNSSRGNSQDFNPFYVQELQRQNDQLIRDNRRLNQILLKRLKHSVADD